MRLDGQVAVVTGGSRGLGLALARALAREGAAVVIASREAVAVDRAAAGLRADGLAASGAVCDVTDRAQLVALRDGTLAERGRLDIWINNAGVAGVYGPVHRVSEESFEATTRTIIGGAYLGTLVALDVMRPAGRGHIVNLLGRGDTSPVPNQVAYAAGKAWVRQFTLAVAAENKGSGVAVHAFNPGLVETDLLGRVRTVSGFAAQLRRLPGVVSVLGQSPEDAARPIRDRVTGDRVEYQALAPVRLARRVAAYAAARLRGGVRTMELDLEEVPDRRGS